MATLDEVRKQRGEIISLASQHGIGNIRIFGSVVRGEETENSDIDLLVTIEPSRRLTDLCRFRLDMKELLGKECDVVSERGLHHLMRDKILSEARPL